MEIIRGTFSEERALYHKQGISVCDSVFNTGESPLKHCTDIEIRGTAFEWRYPVWYCKNVDMRGSTLREEARAGMWYTDSISVKDCIIAAPKCFRRCDDVLLENVTFPHGEETLWDCRNAKLKSVTANGDYFALNASDMEIDGLMLTGHYHFDGVKNVHITNSHLLTKDAFWNSENVTVENSFVSGEYIGWNSKNLKFVNCTIESLQGLCYAENLVIERCRFMNTTLAFEYSTVDADIIGGIGSIKNPSAGIIRADSIDEIILDEDMVDVSKVDIIIKG